MLRLTATDRSFLSVDAATDMSAVLLLSLPTLCGRSLQCIQTLLSGLHTDQAWRVDSLWAVMMCTSEQGDGTGTSWWATATRPHL